MKDSIKTFLAWLFMIGSLGLGIVGYIDMNNKKNEKHQKMQSDIIFEMSEFYAERRVEDCVNKYNLLLSDFDRRRLTAIASMQDYISIEEWNCTDFLDNYHQNKRE